MQTSLESRHDSLEPRHDSLEPRQDACVNTPENVANMDQSTYDIIIDQWTLITATRSGYTYLAVHQYCKGTHEGWDTNNYGWTPTLPGTGYGPNMRYMVVLNRCKKEHDRHVSTYNVGLCADASENDCKYWGMPRRVCPWTPDNRQIDSKAVALKDDRSWILNNSA